MNVGSILSQAAGRWPHRTALVDELGTSMTYREWNSRVNQVAHGLARLGVGHGDRVAFCLRNVEALATAYLATQKLGAVAVPLNYRLSGSEIAVILNDCAAETLIFEDHVSARVEAARPALKSVERFIQVGGPETDGSLRFETLTSATPADEPAASVLGDDLSVLMYTSGTTGTPKAVMLTHHHQWVNTLLCGWELGITANDRTLHIAPLYHSAAYHIFFLTHIMAGGCNVLMSSFDPERVASTIAGERITVLFGVPTLYALLADARQSLWDPATTRSLRLCVSAAATISPETVAWVRERLCDTFANSYGLTETSSLVTILPPAELHRFGTVNCIGRSLLGMETRVVRASVDENVHPDEVVQAGEVGELITRGPKVMLGYLNRPEQSAQRLRNGWLYTGDLVYRDEDDYYYILDRIDDAISVGGEMVYPKEIERVLDQHPQIKQSAVIGAPDPTWGQVIKAFVVPAGNLSAQDVKDYCRRGGQLARFKTPRQIQLVDEIPTNPSGKVLKRELRAMQPAT
ncbi:MAG: class I adenylate-forming enzyme family protein [Chloroflexota bacterium]